jgi:hypothetical protein
MSKTVQIKNNKDRIYTIDGVRVVPGLNTLSKADADLVLNHPHGAIKLERKIFEVRAGEAKKAAANTESEKPKTLADMNADEVIELIGKSKDIEKLKAVLESDTRVTVQRAAQSRIDELDADNQGGAE